jgi:hypothetical protein
VQPALKLAHYRNPLPHADGSPRTLRRTRSLYGRVNLACPRALQLAQNFPGRRIHRRDFRLGSDYVDGHSSISGVESLNDSILPYQMDDAAHINAEIDIAMTKNKLTTWTTFWWSAKHSRLDGSQP